MVAFGASAAALTLMQLVLVGLFASTYAYVRKMEATGCACAAHPYSAFVKNYPLFAIAFLVLTGVGSFLIPKSSATAVLLATANIVFTIATTIFFIMSIKYVEHLVRSKCACSADTRREILYAWSVMHLALIAILLVVTLLGILTGTTVMSAVAVRRGLASEYNVAANAVRNPIAGLRGLPSQLKKLGSAARRR